MCINVCVTIISYLVTHLAEVFIDQNTKQPQYMLRSNLQSMVQPHVIVSRSVSQQLSPMNSCCCPSASRPEGSALVLMDFWLRLSLSESWHDGSVRLRRDWAPRGCSFHTPVPRWPAIIITIHLPPWGQRRRRKRRLGRFFIPTLSCSRASLGGNV